MCNKVRGVIDGLGSSSPGVIRRLWCSDMRGLSRRWVLGDAAPESGVGGDLPGSCLTPLVRRILISRSTDNGKTWSTPRVIDYGGVHNPNLTLLRDGSLLYATALMEAVTQAAYEKARAQPHERVPEGGDRYRLAYKSGEARLGVDTLISGVAVRRSTDRGRTWSPRFMVSPIDGVPELIPGWPTPANLRSPVVQLRNGELPRNIG